MHGTPRGCSALAGSARPAEAPGAASDHRGGRASPGVGDPLRAWGERTERRDGRGEQRRTEGGYDRRERERVQRQRAARGAVGLVVRVVEVRPARLDVSGRAQAARVAKGGHGDPALGEQGERRGKAPQRTTPASGRSKRDEHSSQWYLHPVVRASDRVRSTEPARGAAREGSVSCAAKRTHSGSVPGPSLPRPRFVRPRVSTRVWEGWRRAPWSCDLEDPA